jgi:hypothetical protein
MNTEEARVKTGIQLGGVKPACDRDYHGVRLKYFVTLVYRRKR